MSTPSLRQTVNSIIRAEPDTRLASLAAQYADLKQRADDLNAQLETCKTALKVEMQNANTDPDATDIFLHAPGVERALWLQAKTSWRLDTAGLKAAHPEVYVRFAQQSSTWSLSQVRS